MNKIVKVLTIFAVLLALAACDSTHVHDYGDKGNDKDLPVFVKIRIDDRGVPKPDPETVVALPGQKMEFIAEKKFELYFIGRSPTQPRSRRTFNEYFSEETKSGDYRSIITVSENYKGLPILDDVPEITREDILKLAEELNVEYIEETHDPKTDKNPDDTRESLYIHYLIKVGNVLYDPGARIMKDG